MEYIKGYEVGQFRFRGAYRYDGRGHTVLISEMGTTMRMSKSLADHVKSRTLSDSLKIKLFQRGMAELYGRMAFQPAERTVSPTLFMIDFTTRCNFGCRYCLRNLDDNGRDIDDGVLNDI